MAATLNEASVNKCLLQGGGGVGGEGVITYAYCLQKQLQTGSKWNQVIDQGYQGIRTKSKQRSCSDIEEAGLQNAKKSSNQDRSFKTIAKKSRMIFADQNS